MKNRIGTNLINGVFLFLIVFATRVTAQIELRWTSSFSLPPVGEKLENPGVARPFAGEHDGVVLLAGGANFPDIPLSKGGKKVYQDTIYQLNPTNSTPAWKIVGHLPKPMAEGASITTPLGIVCVGGSVGKDGSEVTSHSFLMKWDSSVQKPIFSSLPDFPYPVRMPAMAVNGTTVYVAGGSGSEKSETSDVWKMDVASAKPEWTALPRLPELTEQPVAAVQSLSGQRTALFVFGGMRKKAPQIAQKGGWFLTIYPSPTNHWSDIPPISAKELPHAAERTMIGASALPVEDDRILVFGGFNRTIWDTQVYSNFYLKGSALQQYRKDYFNRPIEAFAFGDSVLSYHTLTGEWADLGKLPFSGRCGAAVLPLKDKRILLTNGEIAPGIRTPQGAIGTLNLLGHSCLFNLSVIGIFLMGMVALDFYFKDQKKN